MLDTPHSKRQCYTSTPVVATQFGRFKRRRTTGEETAAATNQQTVLDKPTYSRLEVMTMLDAVERRYTEQLEAYCNSLHDLLVSQHQTQSNMDYIS